MCTPPFVPQIGDFKQTYSDPRRPGRTYDIPETPGCYIFLEPDLLCDMMVTVTEPRQGDQVGDNWDFRRLPR